MTNRNGIRVAYDAIMPDGPGYGLVRCYEGIKGCERMPELGIFSAREDAMVVVDALNTALNLTPSDVWKITVSTYR